MEEIVDLESFMAGIVLPEITYVAVFNPDTGEVTGVGPSYAFPNEKFIFELDDETALSIIEGITKIHSCFVDPTSNTLELSEVKTVSKIDDVLHRIIEQQWSDIEKPDIYITYKDNALHFQLTEELHGTYILQDQFQPVHKKKIRWDGDTQLNFFITEYNDPNMLYTSVSMTLSDIIEKTHTVELISPPEKFSVYTRRIFKNYVINKV